MVDSSNSASDEDAELTTVVVAEDDALIRLDLVEMLRESGYEVVGSALDGIEAVDLVSSVRPDVVLLDVKMPRLDGLSAAEHIGAFGTTAIVMLTAFGDADLVQRATDAGALGYLIKPVSVEEIRPAIEVARIRFAEQQQLRSQISGLQSELELRKKVERAKGLVQERLGLSETDAFRWLQKSAMDRRLSMSAVCDAVIAGLR